LPFVSAGRAPEGDDVEEVDDVQEGLGEAPANVGQKAIAVEGARGGRAGAWAAEVDGTVEVDGGRGGFTPAIASSHARRKLSASGRR
jgi:hypothetical protein